MTHWKWSELEDALAETCTKESLEGDHNQAQYFFLWNIIGYSTALFPITLHQILSGLPCSSYVYGAKLIGEWADGADGANWWASTTTTGHNTMSQICKHESIHLEHIQCAWMECLEHCWPTIVKLLCAWTLKHVGWHLVTPGLPSHE